MKTGNHTWDNSNELRTRCRVSLKLPTGHLFFNQGKNPLVSATLMPDGKTLDITIFTNRLKNISCN